MMSATLNSADYCRTCGYFNKSNITFANLFVVDSLRNVLKHLKDWNLNIEENDRLPQGVCKTCQATLEDISNFREKTIVAKEYLELLFSEENKPEHIKEPESETSYIKRECVSDNEAPQEDDSSVKSPTFETITIEPKELIEVNSEEPKIEFDSEEPSPDQQKRKAKMDVEDYDSDNVTLSFLCEIEEKRKYKKKRKANVKQKKCRKKCRTSLTEDEKLIKKIQKIDGDQLEIDASPIEDGELNQETPKSKTKQMRKVNHEKKEVESENLTMRLLREIKGLTTKQKGDPYKKRKNKNKLEADTKEGEHCRYCIGNPTDLPTFANKEELELHLAEEHDDKERQYNCIYCLVKYFSRSGCLKHVNTVHLQKNMRCDICNKTVVGGTGHLREHIATNHTQGDYTCDICGLVLKNSSLNSFKYHKRWHKEDKLLKCDYCERRFIRPSHLREHVVTHTKQCEFLCTHCGKRTRTNWELRCHLYSDHGEGTAPINCNICGENFTKRAQKIVHMKNYHSEKQVICTICHKAFSRDSNLHRHLKSQHGINDIHQQQHSSESIQDLIIQ